MHVCKYAWRHGLYHTNSDALFFFAPPCHHIQILRKLKTPVPPPGSNRTSYSNMTKTQPSMDIEARHGGSHHTINIKYGYIILGLSLLYALFLAVANHFYLRQWRNNGKPSQTSIFARIGSIPLWVHIVLWTITVIVLSFVHVEDLAENYNVVIKRVGRLGYALVPLDVALALRPSLLGNSYLPCIPLHKWILRLIMLCVFVHGGGYFVKWLIEGAFWKKLLKIDNLLGIIVALISLVLTIVSVGPLRRLIYRYFYLWHNVTVASFLVLVLLHARPGVGDFVILLLVMLAFQLYLRLVNTYGINKVSIVDKETSTLQIVRLLKPTNYPGWTPASHVRLGYARTNFRFWLFPAHPYTLCCSPENSTLDLVVKKGLRFQVFTSVDYTVSSPYESIPLPFFATAENINIICGGSGISLGIPLFRYFKHNSSVKTRLFWCVSSRVDAYILGEFGISGVDVFVTGDDRTTLFLDLEARTNEDFGLLDETDTLELESLQLSTADPFSDGNALPKSPEETVSFHKGRPKFDEIFGGFSETDDSANKWLVACGPQSLINEAKAWSGAHGINMFSELYDF